jgi:hypothetical protein
LEVKEPNPIGLHSRSAADGRDHLADSGNRSCRMTGTPIPPNPPKAVILGPRDIGKWRRYRAGPTFNALQAKRTKIELNDGVVEFVIDRAIQHCVPSRRRLPPFVEFSRNDGDGLPLTVIPL